MHASAVCDAVQCLRLLQATAGLQISLTHKGRGEPGRAGF
uniref:Uncharacterized protein n=1 Tax=Anguilla anguilla TaxID=7936 RepID=A0A0E9SFF5_ANGAN